MTGTGGAPSRYERNIGLQPALIEAVLKAPRPGWMDELKTRRAWCIGIGTSFHAAQISKFLWRRFVSKEVEAVHSFDFVRTPPPLRAGDLAVLFTHSGAKSFTVDASRLAAEAGAVTVGVTRRESPWNASLAHRLETCEKEDTGVHSKSMTTALAWMIRWIDSPELARGILEACGKLQAGPAFPAAGRATDLVLIGDGIREWVARETALKAQESCYLRARPFGLEEFLHGPRVSADQGSLVVAFTSKAEARWQAAREYLSTIGVPVLEVAAEDFGPAPEAGWLGQLFWGQRFALSLCKRLGVDPDTLRTHEPPYKLARERLQL